MERPDWLVVSAAEAEETAGAFQRHLDQPEVSAAAYSAGRNHVLAKEVLTRKRIYREPPVSVRSRAPLLGFARSFRKRISAFPKTTLSTRQLAQGSCA